MGDFIYLISITITTALLRLDVPSQLEYANHLESKFDGDIGVLERKHVQADSVIYIGKEANNVDEQAFDVKKAQDFVNKQEIIGKILSISQKQAEALRVSRSTFQGINKRIRESGDVNLYTPAIRRLHSNS